MDAQEASAAVPMTPAKRIIDRFGAKRLAVWTGRHVSRVYGWALPCARGGTGGVVPVKVRARIIDGARDDLAVDLSHSDFELAPGETYLLAEAA